MRHPALLAWLACAALLTGCATQEPSRSLYQWEDAEGVVRYTAFPERIPSDRWYTQRLVEPGLSAAQNAAPPAEEPETVAVVLPPPATAGAGTSAAPAGAGTSAPPAPAGARAPALPAPAGAPPLPPPAPPGAAPVDPNDPLAVRIAELEVRVAADEEKLKTLISDPKLADKLRDSPELREVGRRLPVLQAELEKLRRERAARDGS